jgi:hypothetical protein
MMNARYASQPYELRRLVHVMHAHCPHAAAVDEMNSESAAMNKALGNRGGGDPMGIVTPPPKGEGTTPARCQILTSDPPLLPSSPRSHNMSESIVRPICIINGRLVTQEGVTRLRIYPWRPKEWIADPHTLKHFADMR